MNKFLGFVKFKILEKKLEKIFEIDKERFGLLESLAEAILTCPKLFLHKKSLLRKNKYVTFDLLLVSFSYARFLIKNSFRGTPVLDGDLLGYVYAGSNGLYGVYQHEIVKMGACRVQTLYNIFLEADNLDSALNNLLEEAIILFAHDFNSYAPTHYGDDSPLTVLPIHIQAKLEQEARSYLAPMFQSIERIISGY